MFSRFVVNTTYTNIFLYYTSSVYNIDFNFVFCFRGLIVSVDACLISLTDRRMSHTFKSRFCSFQAFALIPVLAQYLNKTPKGVLLWNVYLILITTSVDLENGRTGF